MNTQLGNCISNRNTANIDKQSYEKNRINMIDENLSDERNQKS